MGYITSFSLTVDGDKDIIQRFRDDYDYAAYALCSDGTTREPCEWYEYKEELLDFSKKYSDALFILEGEGEENGDLWKYYAKNGKGYYIQAEIVWEEFAERKLR